MNSTPSDPLMTYNIEDYYVVCSLSASFAGISIIICTSILIMVWRTKPRLHTVRHLLMCNTSIASMFYCIVIINNYAFLIFAQWETSDMNCRWRAYFAYVGIAGIVYSYLIQAISRFFLAALSTKYRWLVTFKTHYILISIQWIIVFLVTSPALITKDITFYPKVLCWVSMNYKLHIIYTIFAYYAMPIIGIIIIYIDIYYRVRKEGNGSGTTIKRTNSQKRHLEVLRSIIILLSIYLGSALPAILFFITAIKLLYLINLVCLTLAITLEKLCTIFLDRECRLFVKHIICRTTSVIPLNNAKLVGVRLPIVQQNCNNTKWAVVPQFPTNVQLKVNKHENMFQLYSIC